MSRHHLAALLAFLIWGFFPIPLKSLTAYPSAQILLFRVLASLVVLLLLNLLLRRAAIRQLMAQYRQAERREQHRVLLLTVGGGLLLVGNWLLFIYTINHVSVQAGSFAYLICPILTALLGFVVLHEKLRAPQWLAIALSAGSCALLGMGNVRSLGLSLVVALSYALYLISQRLLRAYDKLLLLLVQLLLAAAILLPAAGLLGANVPAGLHDAHLLGMAMVLGVCFTVVPLFLNLYALNALPSGTVGILMYLNPLVSFVLAFLYFQEAATLVQVLAYTTILGSVVLYNLPQRQARPATAAPA